MTYETPCNRPENDPEDWFIRSDGKQYSDEAFLTEVEVQNITRSVLAIEGEDASQHRDRVDRALSIAENDRRRAALQRRRHAREACLGCYFRTNCLEQAIDQDQQHGTWGGLHEEQLRELRREMSRRKRARRSPE